MFTERHADFGVRSMVIVPIIIADNVVGVLALYASEDDFFHEEELKLLNQLANDIAFAIDHIQKSERLTYLAYYDILTGLPNWSFFLESLAQTMRSAAASGKAFAVALIDLERFKNINDSLGQKSGDVLLKQVAEWLLEQFRRRQPRCAHRRRPFRPHRCRTLRARKMSSNIWKRSDRRFAIMCSRSDHPSFASRSRAASRCFLPTAATRYRSSRKQKRR